MTEELHDLIHKLPKDLKRLIGDVDRLIDYVLRKEHHGPQDTMASTGNSVEQVGKVYTSGSGGGRTGNAGREDNPAGEERAGNADSQGAG